MQQLRGCEQRNLRQVRCYENKNSNATLNDVHALLIYVLNSVIRQAEPVVNLVGISSDIVNDLP